MACNNGCNLVLKARESLCLLFQGLNLTIVVFCCLMFFSVVSVGIMNYSIFENVNVWVINVLCDVEVVCSHCRSFKVVHHSK